ncbi:MAG: ComF family protein [Smithellaceae bacterium]|nr:ComF family protein [Smithellaceae bacterium]
MARALGHYEGVLKDAIHLFKYGRMVNLGEVMGEMLAGLIERSVNVFDYSLIIPVPLHVSRLRERGFNQAAVLARTAARRLSLALDPAALKRVRNTAPQVEMDKDDRRANVRGAFALGGSSVPGKGIIVIDDVYTTGSTIKECCRVLERGKAKQVAVFTVARAIQM